MARLKLCERNSCGRSIVFAAGNESFDSGFGHSFDRGKNSGVLRLNVKRNAVINS